MSIELRLVLDVSPSLERLVGQLVGAMTAAFDRRQEGVVSAPNTGGGGPSPVAEAGPSPQVPEPPPEAPAAASAVRLMMRTPEREAILRRDWPADVPNKVIVAKMNDLPGKIVSLPNLSPWAIELGLKRSDAYLARFADKLARLARARDEKRGRTQPEAVAASNQQRGVEAAMARAAAAPSADPTPSKPIVPALPAPAENGKVYATFADIRAWAGFHSIAYDGSNMDRVNKLREAKNLPPLVQSA